MLMGYDDKLQHFTTYNHCPFNADGLCFPFLSVIQAASYSTMRSKEQRCFARIPGRVYRLWNADQMERAVQDVITGSYSVRETARIHKIPLGTLHRHVKITKDTMNSDA